MTNHARRDALIITGAGFLRSIATGLIAVVLGVFLFRTGHDSWQIGIATAAGLAGAAVATALVTLRAQRWGRRRVLLALALLWTVGGLALAFVSPFWLLVPLLFAGMVNAMGTDRSAAYVLEQAILPGLVSDQRRTLAFAWYHLVLDGGGALGALAAGLPIALSARTAMSVVGAYRAVFVGYGVLGVLAAALYLLLSDASAGTDSSATPDAAISPASRKRVYGLASLFALDSFGGGFLTDALVAYFFFRRFGVAEEKLGLLFAAVHVLNALSHLGAAWLAKRIGLVNTMVFTHLPSSLFLIAVPFATSFRAAVLLFLLRESLVEMDVPTRQSYVAAVVAPHERTFASGVTNLGRNFCWAAASALGGVLMQGVSFAAPLVAGGGLKIIYDILLYRGFRHIKPPEEQKAERG